MPPKLKATKPPKPIDPYAHPSQAERKKVTIQLHKTVPRATCRTAGQVVHFANETGEGYMVESDGSRGEGKGKGKGGGLTEDEEDGSGSEAREEAEGEGEGMAGGVSKVGCGLGAKAHKGRVTSSTGYLKPQEWTIVEGVEKYLPRGEHGWCKAAKYYNRRVKKVQQRNWEAIKSKRKPTGDGEGSRIHDAVLLVEDMRSAQEAVAAIEDEPWSESDSPPGKIPDTARPPPKEAS
ncbi:hypothetical protein FRC11_002539, partial [Ceratobasidium sp. 423]